MYQRGASILIDVMLDSKSYFFVLFINDVQLNDKYDNQL